MKSGEDDDNHDEIDRQARSTDRAMVVVLITAALGGIVVTLVSALLSAMS
jgi:hypothetical protein